MSVSTPYFDFIVRSKDEVTTELEASTAQLERRQAKVEYLQSLVDERSSNQRLKRLAKWTALVEESEATNDVLIGRLNTLNDVELPKDEVTFSLSNPTDDISGIQVTITDSPYDDSFVGGQRTAVTIAGTGKRKRNGGVSSFGTRFYIPETFEDDTGTFGIASSKLASKVDGSYPDVTASLFQGSQQSFVTDIITDGQPVI